MKNRRRVLRDGEPFACTLRADGTAAIEHEGRTVLVIAGRDRERLERVIADGDPFALQLFLARITGNFKRGNERRSGARRKAQ